MIITAEGPSKGRVICQTEAPDFGQAIKDFGYFDNPNISRMDDEDTWLYQSKTLVIAACEDSILDEVRRAMSKTSRSIDLGCLEYRPSASQHDSADTKLVIERENLAEL